MNANEALEIQVQACAALGMEKQSSHGVLDCGHPGVLANRITYRRVLEQLPAIAYVASLDGSCSNVYISPQIATMLGLEPGECLSRPHFWEALVHPDDRPRTRAASERCQRTKEPYDLLYRIVQPDGGWLWVRDRAVVVEDKDGRPDYIEGILCDVSQLKHTQDALVAANNTLEERIAARTEQLCQYQRELRTLNALVGQAEERERRRLAHVLHDELGQLLVAAKRKLSEVYGRDKTDRAVADEAGALVAQAIDVSRTLTAELGCPVLYELGLSAALMALTEELGARSALVCTYHENAPVTGLDPELSVLLYRSVRELLLNVEKHAHASHVSVKTDVAPGGLSIAVEDDGIGMRHWGAGSSHRPAGGFGLFGIQERMLHIGGRFDLEVLDGGGTRALLFVPGPEEACSPGKARAS